MSHKRKANDALGRSAPLAELLFDDEFSDALVHVGSFWTGRELSSFFSAALSSGTVREGGAFGKSCEGVLRRLAERCDAFLGSVGAPDEMRGLLKSGSEGLLVAIDQLSSSSLPSCVKQLSEWCALLDYCELTPLRLSRSRLKQDEPIRPLWIVGAGTFEIPGGRGASDSILSVPSQTWRPELLYLGEKWMVDHPRAKASLSSCFFMDPSDLVEDIGRSAAVLSWNAFGYLEDMHNLHDIGAGMLVYHKHPLGSEEEDACFLNWVSRPFSEAMIGRFVRMAFEKEGGLEWMARGTKWDNNMLAIVQVDDRFVPEDHMDGFGERVVGLLKEVDKWCDGRADEEGDSSGSEGG